MRIPTSLLLVFALGLTSGCRIAPGGDPYPVGGDVRVMANGGRSFVMHFEGTGGDCRAQRVIGTVSRTTPDTIYFSVVTEMDPTHANDQFCVFDRPGIMVYAQADAKPSVARWGQGSQTTGLLVTGAVLVGLLLFTFTSRN